MARPKLRTADQSPAVRALLGLYESLASLKLAVVLIFLAAFSLGWATFVESAYGTPAVQFGVYGTWWFAGLNLLLAINIFCAAAIRYPWKRHQTGFVITHIGLLTLLFGCLLSRRGGIDAQMPIFEDRLGHRAFEHSHHLELALERTGRATKINSVPFVSGPFDWNDFHDKLYRPLVNNDDVAAPLRWARMGFASLSGALFDLARRDRGVLYDHDGIQLEVLDYYSDSREVDAPLVELMLSAPQMSRMGSDGKSRLGPERWTPVKLSVRPLSSTQLAGHRYGIGSRQQVGGGNIVFWLTGTPAETEAFLHSDPDGSLGTKGQVVLWAKGEPVRFLVEEHLDKGRFPLGKSGLEAEVVHYFDTATIKPDAPAGAFELANRDGMPQPSNPAVELRIFRGEQPAGRLVLFSDVPEFSLQDYDDQVFGSYWFDHGEKTAAELMQGTGGSRIDLIAGNDAAGSESKLYYRYWNRKQLVTAAPLPLDGQKVDAFKMPIAQLQMYVRQFVPSDKPQKVTLPLPFDKDKPASGKRVAAKVRLTVDGKSSEFWLAGIPGEPLTRPPLPAEQHTVAGDDRKVTVTMPPDEIDVGFQVRLRDFERRLDPGTSQPSHYTSIVDLVPADGGSNLQSDVTITMNAPVDFSDPASGRSYRLFQESFGGPWGPGDSVYDTQVRGTPREELYMSVLTVNYDPGRGIKYTGCLLIVAGIATMFYMRAYFFKPPPRAPRGGEKS